jgi:hypothetical protein
MSNGFYFKKKRKIAKKIDFSAAGFPLCIPTRYPYLNRVLFACLFASSLKLFANSRRIPDLKFFYYITISVFCQLQAW